VIGYDAPGIFELFSRRAEAWRIIVRESTRHAFHHFLPPSNVGRVHTVIGVVVVGSLAFVGTMLDNFFAFAAQLSLTDRSRFSRVSIAHALAVCVLLVVAAGVGALLTAIPLRWIGLLCVAHSHSRRTPGRSGVDRERTIPPWCTHDVHFVRRTRR